MQRKFQIRIVIAWLVLGIAAWAQDKPAKFSREEFQAKCKTIALTPVRLSKDIVRYDSARVEFDSLLTKALQQAGVTVVPSKEYEEIRRQVIEEVGGLFDPLTGAPDTTKTKQVPERCRRELRAKFNADAFLYASIVPVKASFNSGKVKWHGASQSLLKKKGGLVGFFASGKNYRGSLSALSLVVVIDDTSGVNMFRHAGGIQVLLKISGSDLVPVPKETILADHERNQAAVRLALEPLLGKAAVKDEK